MAMKPTLDLSSLGNVDASDDPNRDLQAPPRRAGSLLTAKELAPQPSQQAVDASRLSSFPSREPVSNLAKDGKSQKVQINAYLEANVGEQFKELCRTERYSYGDMIAILMREYFSKR